MGNITQDLGGIQGVTVGNITQDLAGIQGVTVGNITSVVISYCRFHSL